MILIHALSIHLGKKTGGGEKSAAYTISSVPLQLPQKGCRFTHVWSEPRVQERPQEK